MKQKLPHSLGLVILKIAMRILFNMRVVEKKTWFPSTRAKASLICPFPARKAFTSVPRKTMPAS